MYGTEYNLTIKTFSITKKSLYIYVYMNYVGILDTSTSSFRKKYISNLILHKNIYADFQNFISENKLFMSVKIWKQFATVLICMVCKPAAVRGVAGGAWRRGPRGRSRPPKLRGAHGSWPSRRSQITDAGTQIAAELLYMLVQTDSVCSSEQRKLCYHQ